MTIKLFFKTVLIIAAFSCSAKSLAQCSTLCNTDFDDEQLTTANNSGFFTDSQVSCWQTTAPDGQIEVWGNGFQGTPSYSGVQFIEINANTIATIYQEFVSTPGKTVVIKFAHRGRFGVDVINLSIGPAGGPYTDLGNYTDDNDAWGYYSVNYTFPAGAPSTYSVQFESVSAAGNDNSVGNFLDAISMNPIPQPPVSKFVCSSDQPVNLHDELSTATTSGIWSGPSVLTNGFLGTFTPGTNSAGTYNYTILNSTNCPDSVFPVLVQISPSPTADIFINGANPVCPGTQTLLNGSSNYGNASYLWSTGQAVPSITVTAAQPSSSYTLTVTNPAGCSSDSTVTISVYPETDVIISGDDAFCEGKSTQLTASGNIQGMTFEWSENNQISQQIDVDHGGWIYVTGKFMQCPQAEDSIFLTENPKPVVTVPGNFEICPGQSVDAVVSSNQPGSTFNWQPGNLSGSSNTLTSGDATIYIVTASSGAGCVSDPAQFSIVANGACYIIVPNVFTPNGDNNNDFFQLASFQGLVSLECYIINRWGETVVSFNTKDFKWDGKDSSGNELTEGVYFYTIAAVTQANEELKEAGSVTLVR